MTDVETPVDALQDVEGHLREALKALGDVVRCFVGPEKCGKRWFTKGGSTIYRAWFDGSGGQIGRLTEGARRPPPTQRGGGLAGLALMVAQAQSWQVLTLYYAAPDLGLSLSFALLALGLPLIRPWLSNKPSPFFQGVVTGTFFVLVGFSGWFLASGLRTLAVGQ